ncbi:E-phenylitaconyl-CoA hydratase [Rhodoligotrophos appendicifer]|uniref:enoyl-CoA hydratase/isomerase family protein n=1 Tax=Rhodoligotrophos appendicifer TaxID=987056 RepID=UPI001184B49E|nr:enoyl-CoA hydratase-related protein [Rhodoligotrophos appendicifer]
MTIDIAHEGRITLITINRPEARNALDPASAAALHDALAAFEADADSRVAIVTGAGDRSFCAGADLRGVLDPDITLAQRAVGGSDASLVRDPGLTKPVIAAVNGYSLGGGFELALICDIRIASTTASFGLTEVAVGSMPGSGGTQRLPRLIGPGIAAHLALTGERIDAAEAFRIGLVTRVTEPDALMAEARAIAARIEANAPLSVRAVKQALRQGQDMPLSQGLIYERNLFNLLRESEDRIEGRRAFAEKRQPVFKGR